MMNTDISLLRKRWTESSIKKIDKVLYRSPFVYRNLEAIVETIKIEGLNFLDLRGYPLKERFTGIEFSRIDFSFCKFTSPAGFENVIASDCRMVGLNYGRSLSGTFSECTFDECVFNQLIGWPDTKFLRCSFVNADFRRGVLTGSVFEVCSFRGCKMPKTEFMDCQFIACDFTDAVFKEGSVGGSIFSRSLNNFLYVDPNNVLSHHSFVVKSEYSTVDLVQTSTVGTRFRAD